MAYPTTIDDFTNPASGDPLNSPSHSQQHIDINNAVEALEAKVGANGSAVTSSHDYKIAQLESGKEDALGFTPENSANKETSALDTSTTKYPCNNVVKEAVDGKMANPMTTAGDTIYGGASGVPARLGVGTAGQVLTVNSGATAPEWQSGVTASSTTTFTNKRITPRVISATSYTTDTGTSLNADNCDVFRVTAQAGDLLFNAPGGTPVDGQKLIISVASSTTAARALTWNAIFEASTVALPTTTAATTAQLNIGFIYSTPRTKWVCVAVA